MNVLETKANIDYIVQALGAAEGYLKGIRMMVDKDERQNVNEQIQNVRISKDKAITMWQGCSLDDYQALEALMKGEENNT